MYACELRCGFAHDLPCLLDVCMCTCVHIRVQESGEHEIPPRSDPARAFLQLTVGDFSSKYHVAITGPYVCLLRKDSTSPAYSSVPACLSCLPACLPACLSCQPAWLPGCLGLAAGPRAACLPGLPACLPAPACTCLPACLPARSPARPPACPSEGRRQGRGRYSAGSIPLYPVRARYGEPRPAWVQHGSSMGPARVQQGSNMGPAWVQCGSSTSPA